MVTFSTEPISHSTHTYSNSTMTIVENGHSAENLASPVLAEQAQPPPYAASPTRSLFNHGGFTWNSVTEMGTDENAVAALTESEISEEGESSVVNHPQRDSDNQSVNTECDLLVGMTMSPSRTNCSDDEGLLFRMPNLLVNTAAEIMISPPRTNFSGEEALFLSPNIHADMGGGMIMSTSPPRMNYFSPPPGDSIGNSDTFGLWNSADHSEAQELENRKGMMMRPTWKQQQQPCIEEVDAASALGQNQSLGIWAAQNMGGTVQKSCWGSHPHPQTSDHHSVNNVDEWFHMPTLGRSFGPYRFRDDGEYGVGHELKDVKRVVKVTHWFVVVGTELFFPEKFSQNMAIKLAEFLKMETILPGAYIQVVSWENKYIVLDLKAESRGGMMEQNSVTYPQRSDQIDGHRLVYFIRQLSPLIVCFLEEVEFEVEELKGNFCIPQTLARSNRSLDSLILLGSCKPGPLGMTPCLLSLECLCQNMVIQLGNGEQILIMRLNVKLKQAYLQVDFSSEKSNAICSSQALELESWGGMIMERISVSQRWRYAFCSKTHRWSVVLELLDVVVRQLLYLGTNNYSFGISVNDDRSSSSSVNTKMHSLLYFERTFLEMQHLNSLERHFLDHFERLVQTGVLELLSGEEIKLRYLQEEEVGIASKKNHTVSILPALLEAECRRGGNGMMQLDSPCEALIPKSSATNEERNVVVGLKRIDAIGNSSKKKDIIWWQKDHGITRKVVEQLFVSPSTFKRPRLDFGITRRSLEEVGTASEENHTAHIWHAAGRGGMLLQQEDSSSEPHIPESSATNEETNNVVVVDLNNSIDAKGGNYSSEKTDSISRWEKDYGITRQVLEQLFGKSRDDAAKTLKVSTSTFKRACRDFGINRWPNHKGKRPNNGSLNQKHVQAVKKHKGIQRCPALPPEEATTTTLQGNSAMSVKVTYEDNTIRFPLPSSSTMKYLEEQLETRLKICLENFSIMYQDEEADWISLTCDSDLKCGMNVLRSSDKTVVKMKIKPNFG